MYRRPSIQDNIENVGRILNYQYRIMKDVDTDYFIRSIITATFNFPRVNMTRVKQIINYNHVYSLAYVQDYLEKLVKTQPKNKTFKAMLTKIKNKLATQIVPLDTKHQMKIQTQFIYAHGSHLRNVNAYDIGKILHGVLHWLNPSLRPVKLAHWGLKDDNPNDFQFSKVVDIKVKGINPNEDPNNYVLLQSN